MKIENIDIRSFEKSLVKFSKAVLDSKKDSELSYLLKSGAIQHFEFCFELTWKTMKRILAQRGKVTNSPKSTFRDAAMEGLIDNPETWFEFLENRNLIIQAYNQDISDQIYTLLPKFEIETKKFLDCIVKL